MHTRADTTTPTEGAVTKGTGIVALFHEALRLKLVGLGEVSFVEVD
jgi:hypothetical protein